LESICRWLKSEEDDKKLFLQILQKCQKYSFAINTKGEPFPTEPLIMAVLSEQHKMINWLLKKLPTPKEILQVPLGTGLYLVYRKISTTIPIIIITMAIERLT
jgi:hypothetical protein